MSSMASILPVAARRLAAGMQLQTRGLHVAATRFANRFPRRARPGSAAAISAVAPRASHEVGDVLAGSTISGTEAQVASVRLSPNSSIKVDPSSIISVPLGVEVRPIYGAPQLIRQEAPAPASGGLFSRLREAAPTAPSEPEPAMLAEVMLQPGVQPPADAVQLGPVTSSKLHTIQLDDFGNEIYIARGSFLAGSITANLHNLTAGGVPGLALQRVDGSGSVVLKISGQPIVKRLGEGEQIFVQANRIVAVESSTQVLGNPGQMLTNIVGPGQVVLQSLPSLEAALVSQAEHTQQAMQASGVGGGALGSPFGGPMGMGGGLGSMVMQGAAFGVGSAIAHRAFDSAFGGPGSSAAAPQPEAPPADNNASDDVAQDGGDGEGSFFGSMFGGGEEDGGEDDDSDW